MRHAGIGLSLVVVQVALQLGFAVAQPAKAPPRGKVNLAPEITALAGADVEVAARAAQTLGSHALPAAHDALLDALALGLPAPVAVPAIEGLARHPAPADVAALRRYARHRQVSVRAAALVALAGYPDPAAREAIARGLGDHVASVRAAAAAAAAKGRVRSAAERLLVLLGRGEEAAARALGELADPDLARKIADHYGKVSEAQLALSLGTILKRPDFGPDPARVEIVRAIAKIQDPAAVRQLAEYLEATPKNPPRRSREEAELVVNARGGGRP
jgi:HEAT repeat protein